MRPLRFYTRKQNLGCAGFSFGPIYADHFKEPYQGIWMSVQNLFTLRLNLRKLHFTLTTDWFELKHWNDKGFTGRHIRLTNYMKERHYYGLS